MKKFVLISILLTIAAILISLSGCERENSDDVNQDRIYAYYELFYNSDQDITYARASFRFGSITGTLLQLAGHAYVKFNDDYLTFKPLLAYYEISYPGLVAEGEFTYMDLDSNFFVNTAVLHPVDLPETLDTLVRGHVYALPFTGDSIRANEVVNAFIHSSLGTDLQTYSQSNLLAVQVLFAADRTLTLTPGLNTVYVRRNYSNPVQQATEAGAEIHAIWQSHVRQVFVKD